MSIAVLDQQAVAIWQSLHGLRHEIGMAVHMRDGATPLVGGAPHHQADASNSGEGAI